MAGCSCGSPTDVKLVYACSGAANTGLLADQVMRELKRDEVCSGTCLAALGADLSGFIESARSAAKNIVLDGCKVACGAKILQKNGIPFEHYIMTDYGVEKGKTEISAELIHTVAERIASQVQA